MNAVIRRYFKKGHTYKEILEFLKVHDKEKINLYTLKRTLKKLNCFHRPLPGLRADFDEVKEAIREELYGSGSIVGYRRLATFQYVWCVSSSWDIKDCGHT